MAGAVPDAFGNISRLANASEGNYKSLQVSFDRRITAGLQFQVSSTLSEALDMASDPGFGSGDNYLSMNEAADRTFVTDRERGMALRKADLYGPSRFDMRHVASVNGSYELPWKRRPGVTGALVSDWSLSASAQYRDGVPFTILCSANGGDCNLDGSGQDRANLFDASVLGTQIDGYPRTPADTARIYIPIAAFDQTTCRQAGATANCVDVGGGSTQPRASQSLPLRRFVLGRLRAGPIHSDHPQSTRAGALRSLQPVQHAVRGHADRVVRAAGQLRPRVRDQRQPELADRIALRLVIPRCIDRPIRATPHRSSRPTHVSALGGHAGPPLRDGFEGSSGM
jgi:hypothetical protein